MSDRQPHHRILTAGPNAPLESHWEYIELDSFDEEGIASSETDTQLMQKVESRILFHSRSSAERKALQERLHNLQGSRGD
jgi:hypothetical protein